jgi:hypothetical protein
VDVRVVEAALGMDLAGQQERAGLALEREVRAEPAAEVARVAQRHVARLQLQVDGALRGHPGAARRDEGSAAPFGAHVLQPQHAPVEDGPAVDVRDGLRDLAQAQRAVRQRHGARRARRIERAADRDVRSAAPPGAPCSGTEKRAQVGPAAAGPAERLLRSACPA